MLQEQTKQYARYYLINVVHLLGVVFFFADELELHMSSVVIVFSIFLLLLEKKTRRKVVVFICFFSLQMMKLSQANMDVCVCAYDQMTSYK